MNRSSRGSFRASASQSGVYFVFVLSTDLLHIHSVGPRTSLTDSANLFLPPSGGSGWGLFLLLLGGDASLQAEGGITPSRFRDSCSSRRRLLLCGRGNIFALPRMLSLPSVSGCRRRCLDACLHLDGCGTGLGRWHC